MTFGDGVKGRVLGKGTLNLEGFQRLKGTRHVDQLKENLMSIREICDLNLHVNFTCEKCTMMDGFGNCVLEESRSIDNCYTLFQSHTCHHVCQCY